MNKQVDEKTSFEISGIHQIVIQASKILEVPLICNFKIQGNIELTKSRTLLSGNNCTLKERLNLTEKAMMYEVLFRQIREKCMPYLKERENQKGDA